MAKVKLWYDYILQSFLFILLYQYLYQSNRRIRSRIPLPGSTDVTYLPNPRDCCWIHTDSQVPTHQAACYLPAKPPGLLLDSHRQSSPYPPGRVLPTCQTPGTVAGFTPTVNSLPTRPRVTYLPTPRDCCWIHTDSQLPTHQAACYLPAKPLGLLLGSHQQSSPYPPGRVLLTCQTPGTVAGFTPTVKSLPTRPRVTYLPNPWYCCWVHTDSAVPTHQAACYLPATPPDCCVTYLLDRQGRSWIQFPRRSPRPSVRPGLPRCPCWRCSRSGPLGPRTCPSGMQRSSGYPQLCSRKNIYKLPQ